MCGSETALLTTTFPTISVYKYRSIIHHSFIPNSLAFRSFNSNDEDVEDSDCLTGIFNESPQNFPQLVSANIVASFIEHSLHKKLLCIDLWLPVRLTTDFKQSSF